MNNKMKKIIVWMLIFSLMLSNISLTTYAVDMPEETTTSTVDEVKETTEDEILEDETKTTETVSENTGIAIEGENIISDTNDEPKFTLDKGAEINSEVEREGTIGDNVQWTFYKNGLLVISGSGAMDRFQFRNTDFEDKIKYVQITDGITHIGAHLFYNCKNLESVEMADSVTETSNSVFAECTSLTSVILSKNLTVIEYEMFRDCSSLENIVIPEKVTEITTSAFSGCSNLKNINLPEGVTKILSKAFLNCINLTDITLPQSITAIYDSLFEGCSSLTNITVPQNITAIYSNAFKGCSNLQNITIPESVTTLGSGAFEDCKSLTSITIPSNIKYLEKAVFKGCKNLNSVEIKGSLILIYEEAFSGCAGLTGITLPDSVNSIKEKAFYGCTNLSSINIPKGIPTIEGYVFKDCISLTKIVIPEGVSKIYNGAFWGCTKLEEITIPESVGYFGQYVFRDCTALTSVKIPSGVTNLSDTFTGCTSLTNVNIPDGVTNLSGTFSGCTGLTSIKIPDSVTNLRYTFSGCTGLTSMKIPDSVTNLSGTFSGCTGLTSVNIPSGAKDLVGIFEGCTGLTSVKIPSGVKDLSSVFSGCTGLTSIEIPDGVTTLSDTFKGCIGLTSIKIPSSVTTLFGTFNGCTGLTSVEIPSGVTDLSATFKGCTNLTSVKIPKSVKTIGNNTFLDCSNLTSIEIPDGVTSIGEYAFQNCSSLTDIKIPDGVTEISYHMFKECSSLNNVILPDSVTEIDTSGFHGCKNLTDIVLSENLTYIGEYAFQNCTSLESIRIPQGVTVMEGKAFRGCSSLKSIELPKKIQRIGHFTFEGCTSLTNVVIPNGVTELGMDVFDNCINLNSVIIPASVTSIGLGYTIFENCPNVTIIGTEGSYAETFAKEKKIPFVTLSQFFFTVRYDKNSETATGNMEEQKIEFLQNTTPLQNVFVNPGHIFSHWNTKPDGSGISYRMDDDISTLTMKEGEVIVLYAQWKEVERVKAPFASVSTNSMVKEGTEITLKCATSGAKIYYTLDGSVPTTNSILYTKPISIWEDTIITAVSMKDEYADSEIMVFKYSLSPTGDILPEDVPAEGTDAIPKGLWIAGIADEGYTYTGKAIKPEVRVYNGTTLLIEKKDYTISYKNNINANSASDGSKAPSITVTGKGNFSGKDVVTFTIKPKNIDSSEITASNLWVKANEKEQKLKPVVKDNGKTLKLKSNYTLEYSNKEQGAYTAVGNYEILICGTGNYTGTRKVNLTITDLELINSAKVSKIQNQTYTGSTIEPEVKVTFKNDKLSEGTDYKIEYINNKDIGTATVKIIGKAENGKYCGEKLVTFKITGVDLKSAKVQGIPKSVSYIGKEIEIGTPGWETSPNLTAKINGQNVDLEPENYTITYSNNINKGKGTIIFTGKNKYTGTLKKTFTISPYDIGTDHDEQFSATLTEEVFYGKGGSKPKPEVKFGENILTEGKDYTLSYKNNTAVNDGLNPRKVPIIIITGKGNFKGKYNLKFTILPKDISELNMTVPDKVFQDKSNSYKSKPTVMDITGKALVAGTDFDKNITYTYLSNTGNKKAGDLVEAGDIPPIDTWIVATITAKGNYTGEASKEYRIVKGDLSKAKVTIQAQIYTGKAIKPGMDEIKVTIGNTTLGADDYKIVESGYANNVQKGTATMTIQGIGDYGGTKTVKFTIKSKGFLWWKQE